jgi:hypothetical protein
MEVVVAIVALIAVLAVTGEGGEPTVRERNAHLDVDQHTVRVDEEFFKACDDTTVIYRDLTLPPLSQQSTTNPDPSEESE